MRVKPILDRLIVKKDDPMTVSQGGVVIPEQAQERVTRGTILAIGPGKHAEKTGVFIPTCLEVGTKILFHPYAGSELKVGNESYYNMPESDVWAVIVEDE